jgi:hypothetical protein
MKRIIPFFFIIFFAAGVFAQGTITVTVTSSEAGSGLTEIEYEFTGHAGAYDISAEVSFNNGANYTPIHEKDLTGPLTNVSPGTHQLTWDGAASFPEIFSDETIVKITAVITWLCGDDITFNYRGQDVTYGTISKTYNEGKVNEFTLCWMDRNLGADPTVDPAGTVTNTNELLYGDLFQWGRLDDGHQVVTWTGSTSGVGTATTTTQSNTDDPKHGDFITDKFDWRSPSNDNLWQGEAGINNPCPPGWRVPTWDELDAERQSWTDLNSTGAFKSELKWPVGGFRNGEHGIISHVGSHGYVWSSSVDDGIHALTFHSDFAPVGSHHRSTGMNVRCVRE